MAPEGHARFDDPVDAARSLAEDYVGLTSPRLSAFRAIGASSFHAELDLAPRTEANGSVLLATEVQFTIVPIRFGPTP